MSRELATTASLVNAVELARDGEYAAAEKVLRELGGRDSTDPAVLDLLARIHAQRGELLDADECWALALRLDADFTPARAGRQRIAALLVRRSRPRGGRIALAVALTAVAVAGAGVGGALLTDEPPPGPDPAVLAELDDVQESQQAQEEHLEGIDDRLSQGAMRRQQVRGALTSALAGNPAWMSHVDGDAMVVAFPTGVFRTGIRLSDSGNTALADLAQRLGPLAADVSITVTGHTEDTPVSRSSGYASNAELGLARATAAAERMSTASGLPLSAFALSSSGSANPPYPNTTVEGRAQNRTVTVVVRLR